MKTSLGWRVLTGQVCCLFPVGSSHLAAGLKDLVSDPEDLGVIPEIVVLWGHTVAATESSVVRAAVNEVNVWLVPPTQRRRSGSMHYCCHDFGEKRLFWLAEAIVPLYSSAATRRCLPFPLSLLLVLRTVSVNWPFSSAPHFRWSPFKINRD